MPSPTAVTLQPSLKLHALLLVVLLQDLADLAVGIAGDVIEHLDHRHMAADAS